MRRTPLTDEWLFAPRRGRSFSLRLPMAQPQRRWMDHLPWDVIAHVRKDRLASFRSALGCADGTPENDEVFRRALREFSNGRLLLRVIELCPRYAVPPGTTLDLCRARLDRWLPPHWEHDLDKMAVRWTRPTRFACPRFNRQVAPGEVPLLLESCQDSQIIPNCPDSGQGIAQWLRSGAVWVLIAAGDPA